MSSRLTSWKLRRASSRLRALREEVAVVDAQLAHLAEMADDTEVDAVVQATTGAIAEHRRALEHADAMRLHRAKMLDEIGSLERQIDDLLDRADHRPA